MSGVARQREQHADADQVEMAIGMVRHRVAVIGGESLHARRADLVPMTVGEYHPELFFGERPRQQARHRIGADDQRTARIGLGHLEPIGERPCSGRSAALPCR